MRHRQPFCDCRHSEGTILRNIDFNKWERITDAAELRSFQHYSDRDTQAAESITNMDEAKDLCKCGHPLSSHVRNVLEGDKTPTDFPSGVRQRGDIFSGNAEGESGCTECPCRQWKPANY